MLNGDLKTAMLFHQPMEIVYLSSLIKNGITKLTQIVNLLRTNKKLLKWLESYNVSAMVKRKLMALRQSIWNSHIPQMLLLNLFARLTLKITTWVFSTINWLLIQSLLSTMCSDSSSSSWSFTLEKILNLLKLDSSLMVYSSFNSSTLVCSFYSLMLT